jgi:hypothetical protein
MVGGELSGRMSVSVLEDYESKHHAGHAWRGAIPFA